VCAVPFEKQKIVDRFVYEGLLVDFGKSLQDLRKVDTVRREFFRLIRNKHDPSQIDEIRTLRFDGLVLRAYFPKRDHGQHLLESLVVSKSKWKVQNDLGIGAARDAVIGYFGAPDEDAGSRSRYCGETECVTFHFRANTVSKVEFEFYLD